MSQFLDLKYVNADGLSAPVDSNHPDNPYSGYSELARTVLMGDMGSVEWHDGAGRPHRAFFKSPVMAALGSACDLLVAVVHFSDPQYRVPANGVVLNADASLNHQITPPPFVDRIIEQLPGRAPVSKRMPVEALSEVLVKNGRIVIGLNFEYEWVERRYYDAATRQWQEQDQIYRK